MRIYVLRLGGGGVLNSVIYSNTCVFPMVNTLLQVVKGLVLEWQFWTFLRDHLLQLSCIIYLLNEGAWKPRYQIVLETFLASLIFYLVNCNLFCQQGINDMLPNKKCSLTHWTIHITLLAAAQILISVLRLLSLYSIFKFHYITNCRVY